jgi:hypothetical protein
MLVWVGFPLVRMECRRPVARGRGGLFIAVVVRLVFWGVHIKISAR